MTFIISTRLVLVKYSRAFIKRLSQGTSSLASQLTTMSLDIYANKLCYGLWSYVHHSQPVKMKVHICTHSMDHVIIDYAVVKTKYG